MQTAPLFDLSDTQTLQEAPAAAAPAKPKRKARTVYRNRQVPGPLCAPTYRPSA
ncbi:hypothetical protein [Streptomyces sp. NPDC001933]|uniref:hypothetical protein n=1 Tax=Streptomyces sp. NPDC001933 TaxID=3364626 RepID=UPI0036A96FC7